MKDAYNFTPLDEGFRVINFQTWISVGKTADGLFIYQKVAEVFGIHRTPESIARKRGREGITKLNIHAYIPRVAWSQTEIFFVKDHYMEMTDDQLADHLGRSASAVLRIRVKYFYNRMERIKQEAAPPKRDIPYKKSFVQGGLTYEEKLFIDQLKAERGTYALNGCHPRPLEGSTARFEIVGALYLTQPGKSLHEFVAASLGTQKGTIRGKGLGKQVRVLRRAI